MKIITHGKGPEVWSDQLLCTASGHNGKGCGAELFVTRSDLYRTEKWSKNLSKLTTFATFRCPLCCRETNVSRRDKKALLFALLNTQRINEERRR